MKFDSICMLPQSRPDLHHSRPKTQNVSGAPKVLSVAGALICIGSG